MSSSISISTRRLLAGLSVCGAAAGSLLLLGGSHTTSHAAAAPDKDAVVQKLAQDFPLLGRPGSGKDLAADRPVTSAEFAEHVPELIPERGRLVSRDEARTVLIVPRTDGQVCLEVLFAEGGAGANCNSTGDAPILVTYGKAIGVVPASVEQLTYTLTSGRQIEAKPGTDGVFTAPADALSVSYSDASESHTIDLMPASAKPAKAQIPTL
ncbi:hypothetical protein [Baekduia sp. Peel2402]|uniref:hypothetical protein n=1 Tax=Baekduia sp. Peel2402 TaxID=3458296 RepID=UPI00403E6316